MTFVLCHAEDISYWSPNVHGTLFNSVENTQMSSKSTGYTERALSKMDELFLTLVKLCLGLPLHHVANLFNISSSRVSRVFTSWRNLLYYVLGSINFWLPKHAIQQTLPDSFRKFEGGVRVCGIAVLGYFWCDFSVIFISKYGIVVFKV